MEVDIKTTKVVAKSNFKQKYYFAMYCVRDFDKYILERTENFTELGLLQKEIEKECNRWFVQYYEFEYGPEYVNIEISLNNLKSKKNGKV